jgi:transketolase
MDFARLPDDLRRTCVNALRFLAIDGVEKAKSGHPGLPMGAADMAFVLWTRFLKFDPSDPAWINRDRFVFSPGHGSMLLYSLLHLTGYDLPLEELKNFRQWGSRTPGHPEHGHTKGVEVTTGPLGQGFAHAVGLALASRHLAARFNTPEHTVVDARVWGICSDGDLMEGLSAEAASLAGHLKLSNIVFLYDSNRITIDGSTDLSFTEDVGARFEAYGWHVQHVDGHDHEAVAAALAAARDQGEKPALVVARTVIGQGAPTKAGTSKVHGSPLGPDEMARTRAALGWTCAPFETPAEARQVFLARGEDGRAAHAAWKRTFAAWRAKNPEKAAEWDRLMSGELPADVDARLVAAAGAGGVATRAIGGKVINEAGKIFSGLLGGSADLDESTVTKLNDSPVIHAGAYGGRNIHWGIREHAMAAAVNGLTLFGGLRGYGATFLVFSDYMRPSIRLAALMNCPSIFVFTHDSVFLGEDGPTHQPVEHLAALRLMPNVQVWRPADARETGLAWAAALEHRSGPTVIVLTRQKLGIPTGSHAQVPATPDEAAAYVAHEPDGGPEAVLIATGSELAPAVEAAKLSGRRVRVVSMPCVERFLARDRVARKSLIPQGIPVAAVEAGRTDLWRRFTGDDGLVIGIDTFGHSAPAEVLADKLGLTAPKIADALARWLAS